MQKQRFWVGECALAVDDQHPGVASTRALRRRCIRLWAGKRESRAIAKTCCEHAAIATIPAPNIANTIADNRFRSIGGPNWSR